MIYEVFKRLTERERVPTHGDSDPVESRIQKRAPASVCSTGKDVLPNTSEEQKTSKKDIVAAFRVAPNDSHLLVFIPLCNPLALKEGWT